MILAALTASAAAPGKPRASGDDPARIKSMAAFVK